MSDLPQRPSDDSLQERFGPLSTEELAALRKALAEMDYDLPLDEEMDRVLRETSEVSLDEDRPIPFSVRSAFEKARLAAENDTREASVYETPKRYGSERPSKIVSMSRWHSTGVIAGGLAAAAAITIAFVTYVRPVASPLVPVFADAVTLLTPGDTTGFLEPVLTWQAENGGVVHVTVRSAEGEIVASLENAFSPLRWSALERIKELSAGTRYAVEVSGEKLTLASREFETASEAEGAPEPEVTLDGIVTQCEALLAANRAADAWMLWGELTAQQKSDVRMQDLKTRILSLIAG